MRIEVLGNETKPTTLYIMATSFGPEVDVVDLPGNSVDFGSIEVL